MIAQVRGTVVTVGMTSAVIDVNGFGMAVLVTPATASGLRIGTEVTLATSLVVREDSMTLYGFADAAGRDLFELLITANGVGPKLAQAALAVHGPDDLRLAIAEADLAALTKVPGIGRKGAEKISLELRDKVGPPIRTGQSVASEPVDTWRDQVMLGLQGLGWSAKDAEAACDRVAEDATGTESVAELMRAALQTLARK
ncbi:Holliday junction branch migration protein RuvA [Naumannella halotolerans]|uniref:Holliday junction branch migration complex subunit RuvA n=1 Tax=Naumannella halotolerans TaxID=993414 RepID=A0A4R7J7S4_9ACTN|nr:Holliday junction branch migration protein RuvA [Naumannella halotolerans]TDT33510.1 Holliday junction DNA helicase RuvA [Naumannella halotolerans]